MGYHVKQIMVNMHIGFFQQKQILKYKRGSEDAAVEDREFSFASKDCSPASAVA